MGSQFAPGFAPIVDPGRVPLIRIDGLESYEIRDGWVFSRYFVEKPCVQPVAVLSNHRPRISEICLELICSVEAQLRMRRAIMSLVDDARH